jgi:hypothetical protein
MEREHVPPMAMLCAHVVCLSHSLTRLACVMCSVCRQAHLFRDFAAGGGLCHVLATVFNFMKEKSM